MKCRQLQNSSPYICNVFVCVHDRGNDASSCTTLGGRDIQERLKAEAKKRWGKRVRISRSYCMGICQHGANVMIVPQNIWFSAVTPDDVSEILHTIDDLVAKA